MSLKDVLTSGDAVVQASTALIPVLTAAGLFSWMRSRSLRSRITSNLKLLADVRLHAEDRLLLGAHVTYQIERLVEAETNATFLRLPLFAVSIALTQGTVGWLLPERYLGYKVVLLTAFLGMTVVAIKSINTYFRGSEARFKLTRAVAKDRNVDQIADQLAAVTKLVGEIADELATRPKRRRWLWGSQGNPIEGSTPITVSMKGSSR